MPILTSQLISVAHEKKAERIYATSSVEVATHSYDKLVWFDLVWTLPLAQFAPLMVKSKGAAQTAQTYARYH